MKWIWDGQEMEINPVVWVPRYDYTENSQKRVLANGQQVILSKERKSSNISIQCAFEKLTNEQKNFLHSLIGKEFWVETDVGYAYDADGYVTTSDAHNEWKVRIVGFEPRWSMLGYPGRHRRFDIAMELEVVSPYARNPLLLDFGEVSTGGLVTIDMTGTAETWKAFIQITGIDQGQGTTQNVTVTHVQTGRTIGYPNSIPNGSSLVIDMETPQVILDDQTVTHQITGRFFPLQVSENTLEFTIGGSGVASVQVSAYPCYL